ncbi:MAG: hypothetical protein QE285_19450 [Aquabacterium sp.]|nr:hypothetical protein [Aquabacterium sp.]
MAGLLPVSAHLVPNVAPNLWTTRFTHDAAVLAAADTHFDAPVRSARLVAQA